MRIVKDIWRDLRRGENIDLYPIIVISLTATVLSQLGVGSRDWTLSLLLALVGLIAIAMLVNRRQGQRISAALAKLGEASALSQRFLRREGSVEDATRRIAAAREVWLWGTTLSVHLPAFEDEVRSGLARGLTIRVLLIRPESAAIAMAAFRAGPRVTEDDLDADLRRNLTRLQRMATSGDLEVRVIDYLGPYVLYLFDPLTNHGHAIVRVTNFRGTNDDRPTFELDAEKDQLWFAYFRRQFETVWAAADVAD